jgi:hypothetical protein
MAPRTIQKGMDSWRIQKMEEVNPFFQENITLAMGKQLWMHSGPMCCGSLEILLK